MNLTKALTEIRDERRNVGFDSYDITVKQLIDMVGEQQINIAPDYQRRFVWDDVRQSHLIESIYLGIPIPSLFMATNEDSTWEVIDGLQRLTTLINFAGTPSSSSPPANDPLKLKGLEKIPSLNGGVFADLPSNLKLSFLTRPVRITVLNDRSDHQVRFDLFERLNTGGISLHEQEIRNCVFQGAFNDFIKQCAKDPRLEALLKRSDKTGRGNVEELVLKFFAYFEYRQHFVHSVKDFLNEYMEFKTKPFQNKSELESVFDRTMAVLVAHLPSGIVRAKRPNSTPLVLFEAVTVGVADLVKANRAIDQAKLRAVLDDEALTALTTGATNSQTKLVGRINYVAEHVAA
ncbi:GmrSD restriction endonuclease domain-containing protein [Brevundimonas vesicularis]|uniref:DUF262 domain-containing protein n=1 Tax=Brevundimonas vesicularis TaxID=41276 RepID=A0A1Z3UDJ1_BREVE|nr:DUF262 domain-containing protein [Brevundimonas vesicularis]ASE41054.1 DUF262 domain-containing protein [Brevundimonas vesicularis]